MKTEGMQPNTTQVPHLIIREWLPKLSDVELRVLLIVVDQTLGWEADSVSGRRKDRDWMSQSQLVLKTGRSRAQVSLATKRLSDELHLIETCTERGKRLDAGERGKNFGKVYYRLTLMVPEATLFDKPPKTSTSHRVRKTDTRVGFSGTGKSDTTKETVVTKETGEPLQPAQPSAHKAFITFFHDMVQKTRHIKPIITGQDARNLKRVLDHGVDEQVLEQIALYFLGHHSFKTFSPSISTLCSAGILNGLLNRTQNDPNFWKELDQLMDRYLAKSFLTDGNVRAFEESLKALTEHFRAPMATVA